MQFQLAQKLNSFNKPKRTKILRQNPSENINWPPKFKNKMTHIDKIFLNIYQSGLGIKGNKIYFRHNNISTFKHAQIYFLFNKR